MGRSTLAMHGGALDRISKKLHCVLGVLTIACAVGCGEVTVAPGGGQSTQPCSAETDDCEGMNPGDAVSPCVGPACAAMDASVTVGADGGLEPDPALGPVPDPIDCSAVRCAGGLVWEVLVSHHDPELSVIDEGLYTDRRGNLAFQFEPRGTGTVGTLPFAVPTPIPVPGREDFWDDIRTSTALVDADGAPLRVRDGRVQFGPTSFLYSDRALDGDIPYVRTHPNIGVHEVVRTDGDELQTFARVESHPNTSRRPRIVPVDDGGFFLLGHTQARDATPIDLGTGAMECGADAHAVGRFDAEGEALWARCFRGLYLNTLVPAPDDGAFIVGSARYAVDAVDLDTGSGAPAMVPSQVFVGRLSPAGEPLWVEMLGVQVANTGFEWTVASNGMDAVWLVSRFDTPTFDVGGGTMFATPGHLTTAYVARFDLDGQHVWSSAIPQLLGVPVLAVDGAGNVVVGGRYGGVAFDGAPTPTRGDRFLVKFDPNGKRVWLYDDLGSFPSFSLAVDNAGFVHTVISTPLTGPRGARVIKIGP